MSQNLTVSSVWTSKALVDVITVIPVLAQWGRPTILTQCYLRAIHVFWSWRRLAHTRRVEESLHPSVSVVILVVCKAFAMIMSFTGVIYTVETLGPFSPTFYSGLPDADCQSDHCFSFWTSFYYSASPEASSLLLALRVGCCATVVTGSTATVYLSVCVCVCVCRIRARARHRARS